MKEQKALSLATNMANGQDGDTVATDVVSLWLVMVNYFVHALYNSGHEIVKKNTRRTE